jgi:hypothetical protein
MIVTLTDEILHGAVTRMMPTDIGNLPAVSAQIHVEAGFLGRLSVMTRRGTDLKEEHDRGQDACTASHKLIANFD